MMSSAGHMEVKISNDFHRDFRIEFRIRMILLASHKTHTEGKFFSSKFAPATIYISIYIQVYNISFFYTNVSRV